MSYEDRDINILVEASRIRSRRVRNGQPVWDYSLPIKDCLTSEKNLAPEQYRQIGKTIAEMIKSHLPADFFDVRSDKYDSALDEIVEILEDVCTLDENGQPNPDVSVEDIGSALAMLYDWADINRAWICGRVQESYRTVRGALPADRPAVAGLSLKLT